MTYTSSIVHIIEALLDSVITFNPKIFKPFFYSEQVSCDAISKELFFDYFTNMVCTAEANSIGKLTLRIEAPEDGNEGKVYSFYDEVHLHSRLNIIIVEHEDYLFMDVLPFWNNISGDNFIIPFPYEIHQYS